MIDTLAELRDGSAVHVRPGPVVAWVVAFGVGAAATLVPSQRFAESPDTVGWLVGVVLLASGVTAALRGERLAAAWLVASVVAWHLPDLDRLLPTSVRELGMRSSLVHVALLGAAVLVLAPRPGSRVAVGLVRGAALLLLVAAVSGWTGGWRVALPAAGAALVVVVLTVGDPAVRRTRAGIAWIGAAAVLGADLVGEAVVRSIVTDRGFERWLIHAHQLSVAATAVLLALSVGRTRRIDAVELGFDRVANLEPVVAGALGLRSVSIALAGEDRGWLDPTGRSIAGLSEPTTLIEDATGELVAVLGVDVAAVGAVPAPVQRVTRLARDHARLRATISHQAAELEASRRRILVAQDQARSEIRDALRDGPLATLREVDHDLAALDSSAPVRTAMFRARANLEELSRDLDPVAAGRSLAVAIHDVIEACPARVHARIDPSLDLGDDVARTVWFTVSEALANVVKHAPSATASVAVVSRRSDAGPGHVKATILDDGPGGADPSGSGLRGIADRVAALGGTLIVADAEPHGTLVELRL